MNSRAKMTPYPEYKATNLPWLPQIPTHWETRRAKALFRLVTEPAPENNTEELLSVYTHIGVRPRKDLEAKGNRASTTDGYWCVKKGDIICNKLLAWMGAIGVSEFEGVTSPAYDIFRKRTENIYPQYYHYLFRTPLFHSVFRAYSRGIMDMRLRLYYDQFGTIIIPYPNQAEQEQIVRYLDSMTAKINKLIRAKKKQIALLQEQKQAIINQAVTKGLNTNAEMKDSGIDWLGQIPAHWALPHLSFLTTKIGSGKTPKGGAEIYQDSGVMFIRSQNVYFNALRTEDIRYISEEINSTMRSTKVCREDVLLNITGGSIGRCCVFRQNAPANVNQHVCIIRCKKNLILPDYLANILFSYIGQNSIMFCQNEGNRESLTFPQIGAFCIPLPQIEEQKDILQHLEIKTKSIDIAVDKIDQEIQVFSELKNSYIASVVTGQVDVRNIQVEDFDPADLITETDDDPAEDDDQLQEESKVE